MTGRNIFIGVVVLLLVVVAIYGGITGSFTKLKSDLEVTSVASPAPSAILFNQISPMPKAQLKQYKDFPRLSDRDLESNGKPINKAVIETAKGKIEFEIYPEATLAASSFIFLAKERFFDGLTFHRVEAGFVIQGGDPLGTGIGGPGYKFADEPVVRNYQKGTVAMANAGPNTNGSQFFICLEDLSTLPKNYTIFGMVTSGIDVVGKISKGDVMQKVSIQHIVY